MKINIKDVLKNDTEKADLHSEHWLTAVSYTHLTLPTT